MGETPLTDLEWRILTITGPENLFGKDLNPDEYLSSAKSDLANNGKTYSHSHLQGLRTSLKKAYWSSSKSKETLSKYRSCLATTQRLMYQAKVVESHSLEEIMDDPGTNDYQKFIFAEKWLAQKGLQVYSDEILDSVDNAYHKVAAIAETSTFTKGAQRAYDRLITELDFIKDGDVDSVPDILDPEPEVLPPLLLQPKVPIYKRVGSFLGRHLLTLGMVTAVGCGVMFSSGGLNSNAASPLSEVPSPLPEKPSSVLLDEMLTEPDEPEIILASPKLDPEPADLVEKNPEIVPPWIYVTKSTDKFWNLGERFFDDPHAGYDWAKFHSIKPTELKGGTPLYLNFRLLKEQGIKTAADLVQF
jgi:hypothetical protein